jgi:polar amino acid transport system substrate-binding protein
MFFVDAINLKWCLLFLTLSSFNLHAAKIEFITHNTSDFVFTDKNIETRGIRHTGRRAFYVELVHAMMKITGHKPRSIIELPLVRALKEVTERKNMALFSVARTSYREGAVKWVGPLHTDTIRFYEASMFPQNIQTLDDARKVGRICVIRGGNHADYLNEHEFANVKPNKRYEACMGMLARGRVNLAVLAETTFESVIRGATIRQSMFKPSLILYKTEGYIAFSKNISDIEVNKWQQALDKLKETGVYDKLVRQYLCIECTDE